MTVFTDTEDLSQKERLVQSPAFLNFMKQQTEQSQHFHAQYEAFSGFDMELNSLEIPSSERIIEIAEEHINAESLKALIDYELEHYKTFPLYKTPMSAFNSGAVTGWLLFENQFVIVVLTVIECVEFTRKMSLATAPQTVKFNSGDEVFNIIRSDEGIVCSKWSAPLITDEQPIKPGMKCKKLSAETYRTGDRIYITGGTEALSYDAVHSTTVGLKIYCRKKRSSVITDFDKHSQEFKQVIAADQRSTRFQLLASLIRSFECDDAYSLIENLIDHPDYFVRWQAARELVALAPKRALPQIERLANKDRNPLVRKSAAQTIEFLHEEEVN